MTKGKYIMGGGKWLGGNGNGGEMTCIHVSTHITVIDITRIKLT